MSYTVLIKGEHADDDGLRRHLGCLQPGQAWHELHLPPCPDCGGDVVWFEAGYVPGTRKCMGKPTGTNDNGQPTYTVDGGCGSMFSVQCDDDAVFLRRERFYE